VSDITNAMKVAFRFATEYSPSALAYNALSKAYHYSNVGDLDRSHSMPNTPSATGGSSDGVGGKSGNPLSKNLNYGAKKTRQAPDDRQQYNRGGCVYHKNISAMEKKMGRKR
jgi:hypothetical protein